MGIRIIKLPDVGEGVAVEVGVAVGVSVDVAVADDVGVGVGHPPSITRTAPVQQSRTPGW